MPIRRFMHHAGTTSRPFIASLLLAAAMPLASCTTTMMPVQCEARPYHCTAPTDVEFCESEVVAAEGADCADLGLAPTKHFCFVAPARTRCVRRDYAVKDRDCRIVEYREIRQWRECSTGTPTFIGE